MYIQHDRHKELANGTLQPTRRRLYGLSASCGSCLQGHTRARTTRPAEPPSTPLDARRRRRQSALSWRPRGHSLGRGSGHKRARSDENLSSGERRSGRQGGAQAATNAAVAGQAVGQAAESRPRASPCLLPPLRYLWEAGGDASSHSEAALSAADGATSQA